VCSNGRRRQIAAVTASRRSESLAVRAEGESARWQDPPSPPPSIRSADRRTFRDTPLGVDCRRRPGPGEGGNLTSQGHPRTVFRRALAHENLLVAEATAKEIGRIGLDEALELTLLIARKEPHRHPRVAARWLLRYLEERPEATIEEVIMVAGSLSALASDRQKEAARTLRDMAERAAGRGRSRGVA
jgi:hypothetical protein